MDPGNGPIKSKPAPLNHPDASPGGTLRGRVVDAQGSAIAGATIQHRLISFKDGTARGGCSPGTEPLSITDHSGDFKIVLDKPFASIDVKVDAKGFAQKIFTGLSSGTLRNDLTMTEGAAVKGRVVRNGQPLASVSVGISPIPRGQNTPASYDVATDADGRFSFANLPPNIEYMLYGIMETIKAFGALTPLQLWTGGDGSQFDTGELVAAPAHRLAGRVVLEDGQAIPPETRLFVGLHGAWDTLELEVDKDGNFDTTGIPSGLIRVALRVPGYRVSRKNDSQDVLNPNSLVGSVNDDLINLAIFMEKGARLDRNYDALHDDWPPKQHLCGIRAQSGPDDIRPGSWRISGRVTDAKTGQPLATFLVTPGNRSFRGVGFDYRDQSQGIDGVYDVGLSKRFSQPVLKIEADGYLPVAVTPPQEDRCDFAIALQPGQGPSGIVLLPDGKPAANVTVGLFCAGSQGICIRGGQVRVSHAQHLVRTTDSGGAFSFLPELEMHSLIAVSLDGFKLVSLPDLAANPKILLEPWGRVKGTLRRPSGPGIKEDLDLRFLPWLDAGTHTTTDEEGRFEFERVPPGKLELSYRVKSAGPGWQQVPLQSITLHPGQALELNIEPPERVAPERGFGLPPPRPERKLGPPITGTAVLPGGKPSAGIEVALIVPKEPIVLGKGSLNRSRDGSLRTRTDGVGHFTLPGVEGATGIVAVHELGFANIDLPMSGALALTLQPWGEIHGTLRIGRRVGANQLVSLTRHGPGSGLMFGHNEFQARTDDRGRFVITYVPPGEQPLVRWISTGGTSQGSTTPTLVNVKAGEVTEVTLGGSGSEVVGKALFPDAPPTFDWKEVKFSLGTNDVSNDAASKNRFYHPESVTGGSFVFEDVPPGAYQLSAAVHRTRHERNMLFESVLGLGTIAVAIPEIETGRDGELFDVGTFRLNLRHTLNVGDRVPGFMAETPDGVKFQLPDYRGKYVLLSFLFPGAEGGADLLGLKAAFERFGNDDRLIVLSVSRAPIAVLKEFAQANGIAWKYGAFPTRPGPNPFADFFPSKPDTFSKEDTYLIDPEGKIIAKDLHGAAIEEAVAIALART